jgi:hypothetical protein
MSGAWPETWLFEVGTTPGMVPSAWEDVTSRVLEQTISVNYGRPDELSPDDSGTATLVLDNIDGHFGEGITPNTAVRVTNTLDSVTRPVFYQMVESAPSVFPGSGTDSIVDAALADGLTLLAREDRDGIDRPQELTGARIEALLDVAGWPAGLRDIDPGVVRIDPLEDATLNLLAGIRDAVLAEQGQMFIGPNGVFTVRDRHARLDQAFTVHFGTPDLVFDDPYFAGAFGEYGFGEAPDEVQAPVNYNDLVPKLDDDTLWTVARAEMADGQVFEFVDDEAVGDPYGEGLGRRTYPIRDTAVRPTEAEALAAWIVIRYSQPRRRFQSLEVSATDAVTLEAVMKLRPGALVRVQSPAIGGNDAIDVYVHVEKLSHEIVTNHWLTTCLLSPYFGGEPWMVFDDPIRGAWDDTRVFAP